MNKIKTIKTIIKAATLIPLLLLLGCGIGHPTPQFKGPATGDHLLVGNVTQVFKNGLLIRTVESLYCFRGGGCLVFAHGMNTKGYCDGDGVRFAGEQQGTKTYTTVMGSQSTIPWFEVVP